MVDRQSILYYLYLKGSSCARDWALIYIYIFFFKFFPESSVHTIFKIPFILYTPILILLGSIETLI